MPKCFKPYHTSDGFFAFTEKQLSRQNKNIRLDAMRTWFLENYCDPVHCCPHEASEGGYLYIWGGPFDAEDILYSEFGGEENEVLINLLANELSSESPNWSPIPEPGDYFEDYLSKETTLSEIYDEFKNSVKNIEALVNIINQKNQKNQKQYLYRLIYANIITALEAYLSDTFIKLAIDNGYFRLQYMLYNQRKINPNFKKISRSEILFNERSEEDKKYLSSRIWHRLKDTENLFRKVLDITFIDFTAKLEKPIINRHDIIHRNGKNIDGIVLNLTKKDIKNLSTLVKNFVVFLKKEIDIKLNDTNAKKIDETIIDDDLDF